MPNENVIVKLRSTQDSKNYWSRLRYTTDLTTSFRVIDNKLDKTLDQEILLNKNNNQNIPVNELQKKYLNHLKNIDDNYNAHLNFSNDQNNFNQYNFKNNSCNLTNNSFLSNSQPTIHLNILSNELESLETKYQDMINNYEKKINLVLKINKGLINYINRSSFND